MALRLLARLLTAAILTGAMNDKFPTIAGPHYAMDSINFFEEFGPAAFTAKFRAEGMYNFGPSLSPTNAFHILQGMETLPLADAAAYGEHRKNAGIFVSKVMLWHGCGIRYVTDHPGHEIAKRMMPRRCRLDYRFRPERWPRGRPRLY